MTKFIVKYSFGGAVERVEIEAETSAQAKKIFENRIASVGTVSEIIHFISADQVKVKSACYCCSDTAEYRIYDDMKPVCTFHRDEALDEENQPILVMAEENYQKFMELRFQLRRVAI